MTHIIAQLANGWNGSIDVVKRDDGITSLTVSAGNANDGRVVATAHIDNEQAMQLIEALGTAVFGREVTLEAMDEKLTLAAAAKRSS
jgi:hypothetical protein